jgi:hypothetical protein
LLLLLLKFSGSERLVSDGLIILLKLFSGKEMVLILFTLTVSYHQVSQLL